MSCPKEPHFFNFDYDNRNISCLKSYERLFTKADSRHCVVGESSTAYIRSRTAVPAILAYADQPKFVVMIRHPVNLAISLHNFLLLIGHETEPDFRKAWEKQSVRRYGADWPRACPEIQALWYGDRCALGSQLATLYEQVPSENIHLIELEHLKNNTRMEYLRLLSFLEVEDDGRDAFPVSNAAGRRRFPAFWSGMKQLDNTLSRLGVPKLRMGLMRNLNQLTTAPGRSARLSEPAFRAELVDYFRHETDLAEQVTGLDLDHWKR